ncbi:hypothetical protein N7541_011500 [Penicillium brevicompactum]|uniref:Mid2 domain-containing protein n=1 Tax=Penicillium brevicompactum TaxID=5074 RepID=A0A9W9QQG1_PENBR|nr:hypothetical protein N7541_011500 [Penicillium brevicompactum]
MLTRYIAFVFLLPLANSWTFRYTNETNETEIIRGNEERNCTIANISEEKLFTWDPEGSKQCVSIYRDTACDSMGGYSCTAWRKNASRTFMAFDIMPENLILSKDQTSTIASTSTAPSTSAFTSTTSTSSVSVSSNTPTSSPSNAAAAGTTTSGSSAGLSGGAIAGIVIGVVAAVAILIGLVVFFLKRQTKQDKTGPVVQPGGYGPHEADGTGSSMSGTTAKEPLTSLGFRPVPGSRFVELKGDEGSTELGSSPISELDGASAGVQPRPF